jgi:hypothetical protein
LRWVQSVAADEFTKLKFAWLKQVATDPDVSAQAFKAGYFIACEFLNRTSQDAFPSQQTLAGLLGIGTTKGVRYLIDQLVDGGHLSVTVAHGRGSTNRYRLVVKDVYPADEEPPVTPPKIENAEQPATLFPDLDEAAPAARPSSEAALIGAAFDEWWLTYPKRVKKAAARQVYERIVRAGTASIKDLLAGAMRYATERTDQPERYTTHPPKWLRDGCWADEPAPAHSRQSNSGPRAAAAAPSWTEISIGGLRDEW